MGFGPLSLTRDTHLPKLHEQGHGRGQAENELQELLTGNRAGEISMQHETTEQDPPPPTLELSRAHANAQQCAAAHIVAEAAAVLSPPLPPPIVRQPLSRRTFALDAGQGNQSAFGRAALEPEMPPPH